jgi:hypothetical protein
LACGLREAVEPSFAIDASAPRSGERQQADSASTAESRLIENAPRSPSALIATFE